MKAIPYLTERKGLTDHILLDANEHYLQWVKVPLAAVSNLNRYPDPHCTHLRRRLSNVYCQPLNPDNILVTSGSIEAIDLMMYALRPKRIILNTPSYDVYQSRASMHGVTTAAIELTNGGQPDLETILDVNQPGDLLVLINPNNPTGHLIPLKTIEKLLERFKGTVVVDEAYIEYAGLGNSAQRYIPQFSNLIVLRTFSKAWGLAAVRLGYVLAASHIIDSLSCYKNTYSVNALAIAAGLSALNQANELSAHIGATLDEKRNLIRQLRGLGFEVNDTKANFILVKLGNAHHVSHKLKERGIVVRARAGIQGSNMLRITIGAKEENRQLLKALEELKSE